MPQLVLLRHGQSAWNLTNQFAGWVDVDLSDRGALEALEAGALLKAEGFAFDRGYTSYLRRAEKTLDLILETLGQLWIPVEKTWRLNERHYGALQGLAKAAVLEKFGADQYKIWRRSFDVPPPAEAVDSPYRAVLDPRYALVPPPVLPVAESLKDCGARVVPFWSVEMVPRLRAGERLLVVAHGSTVRSLVKHLKKLSDHDIEGVNVPNGVPLVVDLDDDLRWVADRYLGDPDQVAAKISAVAAQGQHRLH
jgi:2,3-bisphosphoglycerate-dependent phosphoglycerate mutase